jgi:ketosteroid isomerase-like protein
VKRIKIAVAIIFIISLVAALSAKVSAYPPFVGKAKKFGAKDCTFCHVDPMGGPPWNDRGKWLIKEKERRGADAIDVEWLADYKPGDGSKTAAPSDSHSDKKSVVMPATKGVPTAEAEVLKTEREWLDAYLKADAAAMERIEADEFSITYPNGEVVTKAQEIERIKASKPRIDGSLEFSTEGTTVKFNGDTAVLSGVFIQKQRMKGEEKLVRERYTDVWVKRNGRWQVVSSQLTAIP